MGSGSAGAAGGLIALWLAGAAMAAPVCDPGRVLIGGPQVQAAFTVEIADDAGERAQGLMYRDSLPASAGMLFVYPAPQPAAFWMQNTLIPLDMIFADPTGTVTRVQADAVPGDLTPLDGGPGVQFVLEINGGLAAKLGIGPGAELRHPAIAQDGAVWPCDG